MSFLPNAFFKDEKSREDFLTNEVCFNGFVEIMENSKPIGNRLKDLTTAEALREAAEHMMLSKINFGYFEGPLKKRVTGSSAGTARFFLMNNHSVMDGIREKMKQEKSLVDQIKNLEKDEDALLEKNSLLQKVKAELLYYTKLSNFPSIVTGIPANIALKSKKLETVC